MNGDEKKSERKNSFSIFQVFPIERENIKAKKYISKRFKKLEKSIHLERKKSIKFLIKKSPYFKIESFSY